ncbi:hypothetical protein GCM10023203_37940 [Actinomycetospora straminea]|uniref:Transposase IS204/IS1001/IS1096/IS1165 DDE domain-containing protein n=1 Tax=Actinomycetospora straminea TaxID=663607 RepID=A0ABP9EM59_9PSEU
MIAAYRHPDRAAGRHAMTRLIIALSAGVPATLTELRTLGRTLRRRATDILAYFDRPGTSNGPTEAMNGRLEHLRGSALGFRNLTHYIARSLLEAGGFRPQLTLIREESRYVSHHSADHGRDEPITNLPVSSAVDDPVDDHAIGAAQPTSVRPRHAVAVA